MCQIDGINSRNSSCYDYPDMSNYSYIDWYLDTDIEIDDILRNARQQLLPVLKTVTMILSLIGIVGIVGNILVILVFSRTLRKQASTYLVLMLAITDLIACSLVIPGTLLKEWFVEIQNDIMCKVAELLRHYVIISSAMILVAIAFNRYWMIYKRSSHDNNKRLTLVMMLVIVVVAISFSVPSMLQVGVYRLLPNGKLININICEANDLLISVTQYNIHWNIITGLFSLLLVTIIILYTLIFIMVYKHRNKTMGALQQNHKNLQTSSTNQQRRTQLQLPFVGQSPTVRQRSMQRKSENRFKTTKRMRKTVLLNQMRKVFRPKTVPISDQVVQINIINNSSASNLSLSDQHIKGPSGSGKTGTSMSPCQPRSSLNARAGTSTLSPMTAVPCVGQVARRNKNLLPLSQQTAHIKTTQVLCIITLVYVAAFLPMFLITHEVISNNMIVFYLYYINNAANPIIYSFMNRKFRQQVWKMFACKRSRVWPLW